MMELGKITGALMLEDQAIAMVQDGIITDSREELLPIYLKRTGDVEGWLASRAIDAHRRNSRLLKKVLRIRTADDAEVALAVNGATITDRYWFQRRGEGLKYDEIRFKENYFSELALRGDPDSFSNKPSRTPELTNIGSFEKCWKLLNQEWWMYKSGNAKEYFSELFICRLGEKLGFPMAYYEMDGQYIRTRDFTQGGAESFEPMSSLMGEDDDYSACFHQLLAISSDVAKQYLQLIWMDSICFNMDRHTRNFGLLRDLKTGAILSLAPNYDNNIALIANGYPSDITRERDGLIGFLERFLQECEEARKMLREMKLPTITEEIVTKCISEIPADVLEQVDTEYVKHFVLNGQERVRKFFQ